ncbi:MAG: hypothetical protein ACR2NN_10810 [Bryobacteraceae bacterium]
MQTPRVEETAAPAGVEVPSLAYPELAAAGAPPTPRVEPAVLRLAYSFEFLLALLVIVVGWTQIGGQAHMDLMPWYIKLCCVALLAWCGVRLTAAMVEQPKAWNRASRNWLIGVLLAGTAMAGVTYYVHLHEVPDEQDTDETSTTSVRNLSARHLNRLS